MNPIERFIYNSDPQQVQLIGSGWDHFFDEEEDKTRRHTYRGYVTLETDSQALVIKRTFTGTQGNELEKQMKQWITNLVALLSVQIEYAVVAMPRRCVDER